jgi:glycosyltransferase involved in cell wall biosynthesis
VTPRLDYVSPLPPVRSGIADYSVDLLPHLAAALEADGGDLRVLGLPGQPVDPAVAERFGVVPAEEVEATEGGRGDRLPLYQMGNNRHHEPVEAMALSRPGVLTLHDLVLHHLLSEETLGVRDFDAYRSRLAADHGWIGEETARPREWGAHVEAMLFELPAHRTLLRRQRGVLVHNRWAAARLAAEDPELRVAVVPMGVPLPRAASAEEGRAFRRRFGVPEGAPVLGSFGFQTPIKRTAKVVEALALTGDGAPLSGAHLLVVGETCSRPGEPSLEELARELGVAERVHVTGFVPYDDFEASIAACDLALNLRYPTAGETSASLLRVLAVGRPAVVSDHAQFAELPDEVVVKVPFEGEVEALVERLSALLADPGRLAAMGEAAREHVRRQHDPAAAAAAVVAACREWREAEPLDEKGMEIPPPTSLTRERLPGTVEWLEREGHSGAEGGAWPPGERRRLTFRLTNHGPARWLAAHRGPGGAALRLSLASAGEDLLAGRPWLPLPRDLAAGESCRLEAEVRRPPVGGPSVLRAELRVAGVEAPGVFAETGVRSAPWSGPAAEWELGWR